MIELKTKMKDFDFLTEREKTIIYLREGLNENKKFSVKEISCILSLSRQTISKYYYSGMRKIKKRYETEDFEIIPQIIRGQQILDDCRKSDNLKKLMNKYNIPLPILENIKELSEDKSGKLYVDY